MPDDTNPTVLITMSEICRRAGTCPRTAARKLRGNLEPVAFLAQGKKEPLALYNQADMGLIKLLLMSDPKPSTTIPQCH